MNVFDLPAQGSGYEFGSSWGTGDLQANFNAGLLTLAPCTNVWNPTDTYWVQGGSAPYKNMDASMYVQSTALAGQTVTFDGSTVLNSLSSPYTSVAFIKDFTTGYTLVNSTTEALVSSEPFSITLATQPGDIIQYGFETIGPDAVPGNSLGVVEITAVPEPSTFALLGLGALGGLVWRRRQ
jgi:hypothetical protein